MVDIGEPRPIFSATEKKTQQYARSSENIFVL